MHYKKLLEAHKAFYSGENRARYYDEYMRHKDWQSWGAYVSDIEIIKLFGFILSWEAYFQGDLASFKQIYQEIYPIIQRLESERIENADFGAQELKGNICQAFDKVEKCTGSSRRETTAASKILHTILPNLFVMWDRDIRRTILGDEDKHGKDYAYDFLPLMQREIREAINTCMTENNLDEEEAIRMISGYCDCKTLAKLIDELNYMQCHFKGRI